MTSNVASDYLQELARRGEVDKDALMDALRRTFRPEFLNRIDEIVTFHALGLEHVAIVDIQLKDVQKRLVDRKLSLTKAAKALLAEQGFDPTFGARPLKRTIQPWSKTRWQSRCWPAPTTKATRSWSTQETAPCVRQGTGGDRGKLTATPEPPGAQRAEL